MVYVDSRGILVHMFVTVLKKRLTRYYPTTVMVTTIILTCNLIFICDWFYCHYAVTLILKPGKNTMTKENGRPTSLMNIGVKIFNNISKPNLIIH